MIGLDLVLILVLVGLDQWVKVLVSTHFAEGSLHVLIPGVLGLTNLHNNGAAWSMLAGQQGFFAILTIVVLIVLGYLLWRYRKQRWLSIALSLMTAGAIGNFIDRMLQGYVVDMFQLLPINFPVFNVADSCLTIGVIILIILVLREDD